MNRLLLLLVLIVPALTACTSPGYRVVERGQANPWADSASMGNGNTGRVAVTRYELLDHAMLQLGVPYRYGGTDRRGFDCSGLVSYVHQRVGVPVPRTAAAQRRAARPVALTELQTGDLVFFRTQGGKSNHVGIYEGAGRFIHAPSRGKNVSRSNLNNPYWRKHLVGAGTYL